MTCEPLFPFMYDDSNRTSNEALEHLVSVASSTKDIELYDTCIKEVDNYKATNDNICFITYLIRTHYQKDEKEKEERKERNSRSYS